MFTDSDANSFQHLRHGANRGKRGQKPAIFKRATLNHLTSAGTFRKENRFFEYVLYTSDISGFNTVLLVDIQSPQAPMTIFLKIELNIAKEYVSATTRFGSKIYSPKANVRTPSRVALVRIRWLVFRYTYRHSFEIRSTFSLQCCMALSRLSVTRRSLWGHVRLI
jgi:hypothetical protein